MKNNFLNISVTNIYSKPSLKSEVTSQILYGEKFKVLSKKRNWVKSSEQLAKFDEIWRKKLAKFSAIFDENFEH